LVPTRVPSASAAEAVEPTRAKRQLRTEPSTSATTSAKSATKWLPAKPVRKGHIPVERQSFGAGAPGVLEHPPFGRGGGQRWSCSARDGRATAGFSYRIEDPSWVRTVVPVVPKLGPARLDASTSTVHRPSRLLLALGAAVGTSPRASCSVTPTMLRGRSTASAAGIWWRFCEGAGGAPREHWEQGFRSRPKKGALPAPGASLEGLKTAIGPPVRSGSEVVRFRRHVALLRRRRWLRRVAALRVGLGVSGVRCSHPRSPCLGDRGRAR